MRISKFSLALVFALAACAQPKPPPPPPPPPLLPVGHVYPVSIAVPPHPKWVKITPAHQEALQQAFNVIGLKSALMVGALTCGQQAQYDAFMSEFQPHILDAQHTMDAYFRRVGSRTKEDAYVTLLANNQSVAGSGEGGMFCLNSAAEFKAVLSLQTPAQLDQFVTDQPPAP